LNFACFLVSVPSPSLRSFSATLYIPVYLAFLLYCWWHPSCNHSPPKYFRTCFVSCIMSYWETTINFIGITSLSEFIHTKYMYIYEACLTEVCVRAVCIISDLTHCMEQSPSSEKLIIAQLVVKFISFYGKKTLLIAVLTRVRHWVLTWAKWTSFLKTHLSIIFFALGGHFRFCEQNFCLPFISSMPYTWISYLILLLVITLTAFNTVSCQLLTFYWKR
jgi:hypothetical protein